MEREIGDEGLRGNGYKNKLPMYLVSKDNK